MEDGRYSRISRYGGFAATLPRWREAMVAVVGLGGLGGGLALHLARFGVRRLVLIDRDLAGGENLGHQALFTEEHVARGLPKARAAVEVLTAINSTVEYVPRVAEITRHNLDGLLDGCTLVFDGLDNYYARLVLNDYVLSRGIPYFYAGVVRGELSARAIIPGVTGCLRCLVDRPPAPGEIPTCAAEGVFPPLLGLANALQLDAANRWLTGEYTAADDVLYSLRLPGWELRRLPLGGPGADCPACAGRHEYLDGTLDHLAAHACSPGRSSVDTGRGIDLGAVEKVLAGAGLTVRANRFCLSASGGGRRYTVFPDGRISLEGGTPEDLNRFIATYLGS